MLHASRQLLVDRVTAGEACFADRAAIMRLLGFDRPTYLRQVLLSENLHLIPCACDRLTQPHMRTARDAGTGQELPRVMRETLRWLLEHLDDRGGLCTTQTRLAEAWGGRTREAARVRLVRLATAGYVRKDDCACLHAEAGHHRYTPLNPERLALDAVLVAGPPRLDPAVPLPPVRRDRKPAPPPPPQPTTQPKSTTQPKPTTQTKPTTPPKPTTQTKATTRPQPARLVALHPVPPATFVHLEVAGEQVADLLIAQGEFADGRLEPMVFQGQGLVPASTVGRVLARAAEGARS